MGLAEPCGELVGCVDGEADGHSPQLTPQSAMTCWFRSVGLQNASILASRASTGATLNSVRQYGLSALGGLHGSIEVVAEVLDTVVV